MVKKTPEATEAFYENLFNGLFVFLKKRDIYFGGFDMRCFYIFKLENTRTRCYRVIVLLEFQLQGIISAIHTARINLSPFTKDFRVWVALQEISIICLQAVPSGTATPPLYLNYCQISVIRTIETTNINNSRHYAHY